MRKSFIRAAVPRTIYTLPFTVNVYNYAFLLRITGKRKFVVSKSLSARRAILFGKQSTVIHWAIWKQKSFKDLKLWKMLLERQVTLAKRDVINII